MSIGKLSTRLLRWLLTASVIGATTTAMAQEDNCGLCHFASPATAENLIVEEQAVDACDYSDADQFSGWGWNAATSTSCPPLDSADTWVAVANEAPATPAHTATANCDYSNAADFDGWGWNNNTGTSCPPLESEETQLVAQNDNPFTSATNTTTPICISASSDPDGDGWGWENNRTCQIVALNAVPVTDNSNACIDTDGDGWGWDGSQSCQVGSGNNLPQADQPLANQPQSASAACVDPDGDGYGWNGFETCVPGNAGPAQAEEPVSPSSPVSGGCLAPASGTTVVSNTGPVRSTGNAFFPNNGPQCVTPENQFNGPGLRFGDFLLLNNAWNAHTSAWDWTQCISLTNNNGGTVAPSWDYDWGNEDALQPGFQEWEVKTFPEVIYGVKSESEQSAACETTGLPVPYGDMPSMDISYSYRATQTNNRIGDLGDENNNPPTVTGGDRNIAIETFLHSSCDIQRGASSNIELEVMVWLEHGAERLPTGSPPVAVYTAAGGSLYDVYVKDNNYIAYVAQNEVRNGTLSWDEFLEDARTNASTYGIKAINNDWCVANVIFGSEIWWGQGTLDLDHYEITRHY